MICGPWGIHTCALGNVRGCGVAAKTRAAHVGISRDDARVSAYALNGVSGQKGEAGSGIKYLLIVGQHTVFHRTLHAGA